MGDFLGLNLSAQNLCKHTKTVFINIIMNYNGQNYILFNKLHK